jgi:hypothetical protein
MAAKENKFSDIPYLSEKICKQVMCKITQCTTTENWNPLNTYYKT